MSRRTRRIVAALVVVVVAVIAAAVLVPRWIDADRYRAEAERTLAEMLGREVELGPLRLTVGLGVHVRTASLRVGPSRSPGARPAPEVAASDVRLRAAFWPLLRGRFDVRGLSFRAGAIEQSGEPMFTDLALDGRLGDDGEQGRRFEGRLTGRADVLGGARFDGTFDSRILADRVELIALGADVGPGRVDGSGRVAGLDTGEASVDLALRGRFGGTVADGTIRADLLDDRTVVDFEIAADRIDFDELATLGGLGVRRPPPANARGVSWSVFPVVHAAEAVAAEGAAELLANGSLRAREARFAGLTLTAMEAAIRFEDGAVTFDDAAFELYGGRHDGRFRLDVEDPGLPFTLHSRLSGVDVDGLLSAFRPDLADTLHGTGALAIDVRGRAGDTSPDGGVVGRAELRVEDGRLAGVALLDQISAALSAASGQQATTAFTLLAASFDLKDRRARTDDLRLRSRDLDLDGRGDVRFDGRLDLDLTAALSQETTAGIVGQVPQLEFRVREDGRLTLPIAVRGSLAEPEVGIDLRKVLEDGLGRKLKDALKDLFGR